jgi:D-apiose dehydrogenase
LGAAYELTLHTKSGQKLIEAAPEIPAWGAAPWQGVQDSVIRFETHVLDVLNGRALPQPSGADNLKTLALALAAYESAENNKTIEMANWKEAVQ